MRVLCAAITLLLLPLTVQAANPRNEIADRVQRTKTIRCGYYPLEPFVIKGPGNSLSGVFVEYLEQVAAAYGMRIWWVSEVSPNGYIPLLQANKIDALCTPVAKNITDHRDISFAGNFGQIPYFTYVNTLNRMSEDQVLSARFVAIEGNTQLIDTNRLFPMAKVTILPRGTSQAAALDYIKFQKVDAMIVDELSANMYNKTNTSVLRKVSKAPVLSVPIAFPVPRSDIMWQGFFHMLTDGYNDDNAGVLSSVAAKYGINPATLFSKKAPSDASAIVDEPSH